MLAVSLDIGGRHIGCENAAQPGAVPVLPGSLLLLQTDGGAHKREREDDGASVPVSEDRRLNASLIIDRNHMACHLCLGIHSTLC
jgi:hypothetical protein